MKQLFQLLAFSTFTLLLTGCGGSKMFLKGEAPEAEYTAQVPFTRSLNLIIVEIEMGGKPRRFLFDSGAPMVVSEELAKEFDMKVVTKNYVKDSGGQRKRQNYVRMPNFNFSHQPFGGFTAIVVDLNYSPVIACLEIDGILGANMMRRAFWKIDFVEEVMYFSNYDEFLPEGKATVLPFRTKSTFTPVVDLMIDSTVVKNVTFDTGSANALSISRSIVPEFDVNSSDVYSSYGYQSSGIFGALADTAYYLQKTVSVGKTPIPAMMLSVHQKNGKALLGTGFFEDYDVVLNWQQRRAFLIPATDSVSMGLTSIGFSVVKQGDQLIVSSVTMGQEAEQAGLAFGDRIIEINGITCTNVTGEMYCEIRSMLSKKDQPVTVTVENKGAFTFEWEKYF